MPRAGADGARQPRQVAAGRAGGGAYARGLVRHVPGLMALEDELCAFGPDGKADGHSPDRVDALVWALTELVLNEQRPRVRAL